MFNNSNSDRHFDFDSSKCQVQRTNSVLTSLSRALGSFPPRSYPQINLRVDAYLRDFHHHEEPCTILFPLTEIYPKDCTCHPLAVTPDIKRHSYRLHGAVRVEELVDVGAYCCIASVCELRATACALCEDGAES